VGGTPGEAHSLRCAALVERAVPLRIPLPGEAPDAAAGLAWSVRHDLPSNSLRGRSRRLALAALAACAFALVASPAAPAKPKPLPEAHVSPALLDDARSHPDAQFDVIVRGDGTEKADMLADRLAREVARDQGLLGEDAKAFAVSIGDQFESIAGFRVTLSGREVVHLATKDGVRSMTADAPLVSQATSNNQIWDDSVGASWYWTSSAFKAAKPVTIAVVDSGVDASAGISLGSRFLGQFDLGGGQTSGDSRGHGTFVAGIAAGNAPAYAGTAPNARVVALDVFDDQGVGTVSNAIRAVDWILANRTKYNIRVANFSLQSSQPSSFLTDPLDQAVERLWQAGIVVVAAAGNYAVTGQPSGVGFAPANDPFVITVGAADVNGTISQSDDVNAPWSAYGYTFDGFAKPELAAPGRYQIQPIGTKATLRTDLPGREAKGKNNYQLSGTSFAAPVVSGAAAILLGAHPEWTPDQVKGALMLSAQATPRAAAGSLGVGEVNVRAALSVAAPPNPNQALNAFLAPDPAGGALPVFDAARWSDTVAANPAWSAASWSSASWSSASWSSASWSSASWSSASWSSASWSSASWSSVARVNGAAADGLGIG
jgi:serine protease AprX